MDLLYCLDRKIGHPFKFVILKISNWIFRGWQGIHNTGLEVPEEDEGIWFGMMLSPAVILLSPFYEKFDYLSILDKFTDKEKSTIMSYYKNCLLRMQYHFGKDKTLLIKSVMASGRVRMYADTFPMSQIVYLDRSSERTVPSYISMFTKMWNVHSRDMVARKEAYRSASLAPIKFYHYVKSNHDLQQSSKFISISYDTFISEPYESVLFICNLLFGSVDHKLKTRIKNTIVSSQKYKSTHSYSLEKYGLDVDDIENFEIN